MRGQVATDSVLIVATALGGTPRQIGGVNQFVHFARAIRRALLDQFFDLSDVEQGTRIILRLVLAALLGGLLELQRE